VKILLPDADIDYIEGFYSPNDAAAMFAALQQSLAWRKDDIVLFGKSVPIPRLQAWYGDNNLQYRYSNLTLTTQPWISHLLAIKAKLNEYCHHEFNAVLANLYRNEKDSVGWHSDDEPELGKMPTIASLSFGATREFQLKHKVTGMKKNILLNSGSLLIMQGKTQHYWQHCLPKRTRAIAPRINLTFRKIIL
jgi:alkylated DNA repair dioxygenase AlkB